MTAKALREAQDTLDGIMVIFAEDPVTPTSHIIYERMKAAYPPGTMIHLDAGYLWDNFQRDIGNQKDLYLNEDQIRRALMDLIAAGLVVGNPRVGVAWVE